MAPSTSMTAAPPITNYDGTRKSSRIPAIKLKQAEKEASSRQAELQLSKASQAKIAKTKARKQLLDQVISFREKLADPALESELGNLLKQFLRHEPDEVLKTAVNKIDFTTSISPSTSTHKRRHEATDLNVTDSVKPYKKARINKEHASGTSDRVIAAPRSRPRTDAAKSTRSSKVTTAKSVKRKSDDTDDPPPSKKRATAKPSNASKVTKPKDKRTTRSKETIAEASRKISEGASYSSEDQAEAHADVNDGTIAAATVDSTVDANADAITDANAQGELEIHDQVPSPAKADTQGEVRADEAEDEAPASVIAKSSAQAPSQSPDETVVEILPHEVRITYFISLGIVMRRPGAGYGDTLDLSDSSIRSIMDRQLSEPTNALDDRIMALLMAPHNKDCEADNWTIDFEECSYAYESAGDVNGGFVRDKKRTVEPFEYKSYYSMTNCWKNLRKIGIGLWDEDNDGLYGCCGVNHPNNVITLLGCHHAGDESESGLEKRLNRLFHFIQTHRDVAECDIDPLDGRRIQYGIFIYKYSMANDPAYIPSAAFAGDDDEDNYD